MVAVPSTKDDRVTAKPKRKVIMAFASAVGTVIGIALLNEFVLSEKNQVPLMVFLAPFVPVATAYLSKNWPDEGVA
jgi:hypothetical protein